MRTVHACLAVMVAVLLVGSAGCAPTGAGAVEQPARVSVALGSQVADEDLTGRLTRWQQFDADMADQLVRVSDLLGEALVAGDNQRAQMLWRQAQWTRGFVEPVAGIRGDDAAWDRARRIAFDAADDDLSGVAVLLSADAQRSADRVGMGDDVAGVAAAMSALAHRAATSDSAVAVGAANGLDFAWQTCGLEVSRANPALGSRVSQALARLDAVAGQTGPDQAKVRAAAADLDSALGGLDGLVVG